MRATVKRDAAEGMTVFVDEHDPAGRLDDLKTRLVVDTGRPFQEPARRGIKVLKTRRILMDAHQIVVLLLRPRLIRNEAARWIHDRSTEHRSSTRDPDLL